MKPFATLFLPPAALLILIMVGVGLTLDQAELDKLKVHETGYLANGSEVLLSALDIPLTHLRGLIREPAINQALQASPAVARSLMEPHLLTLAYRNPRYDRATWLSPDGRELVRVDNTPDGPAPVPAPDLQDQSTRDDFQAAIRLAPGQVYVSPLDLNIEREVVAVPSNPLIRFLIRLPVVAGRDQGLIMIHYRAQPLLDHLLQLAQGDHAQQTLLLNPGGDWLLAPDPDDAWPFRFGRPDRLEQRHPQEGGQIGARAEGQILTPSGLWRWTTIDPASRHAGAVQAAEAWKLVTLVPTAELWRWQRHHWWLLGLVTTGILVLLGIIIHFYLKLQRLKARTEAGRLEEASLRQSERRWKAALDGVSQGVWDWYLATDTVDYSPGWKAMLGYADDEIGNGLDEWSTRVHPDDLPPTLAAIQAHLAGTTPAYESVHRLRCKDGDWKWILDRGTVFERDAKGQPLRMIGAHIDITAQKEAEARLSRSEEHLRLATDGAELGIWYWEMATLTLNWSRRCKVHLGLPSGEEPSFDAFYASMHPDDRGRIETLINQAVVARSDYAAEYRVHWTDGSEHWISASGRVYAHPDGTPRGMGGITQDITAQKRAGEEIRALYANLEQKVAERTAAANAANQAKSEFLAHMSHEIRTPMNAVLGLAQLLHRERLSPNQAAMVERIQAAGQSLLGIINDILDFSKIEAGQLRLEIRPFDLAALLHKLNNLLAAAALTKGLALRINPPPASLGPVQGDPLRLEQVLVNLIGNGIKFTDRGEVALRVDTLTADAVAVRLRFAVRDTGIGISPAALTGLFQPFAQADIGITRRFGGSGLGLSISQRLVALMGGTIQVESAEGQGSTFGFELTFARATAQEAAVPAAPVSELPDGPRLSGLRVLVVDDSPMNRDLVERLLTLEGAQVTLAGDGQQAVQLLQTPTPAYDAVLMDVQMPVMDGRTATRVIRDRLGLRDLPIIALTAGVLAEEQQAIRDAGVDAVLAKPLDLEQLVAMLLRLIPAAVPEAADQALGQGPEGDARPRASTPPSRSSSSIGVIKASKGHRAKTAPVASTATRPHPATRISTTDSAAPRDFPLIAGIDRERAARVVGNDRAFFLSQLGRLLRDAATTVEEARLALLAGDRETATRRMHSLKGNAGNLGALKLMRAAAALERAIKDQATDLETTITDQTALETIIQDPATDLEAGLADLERQLEELAAASAPWLAEGTRPVVSPAGDATSLPTPPLAPERLAVLRDALQRHDLAAQDQYEELAPALTAVWGEAATRTLGEAIADLKFGAALTTLENLTRSRGCR